MRKGRVAVEFDNEDFHPLHVSEINNKRHPRSAVGYDRKKRYLYFVMVEGRATRPAVQAFRRILASDEAREGLQGLGFLL